MDNEKAVGVEECCGDEITNCMQGTKDLQEGQNSHASLTDNLNNGRAQRLPLAATTICDLPRQVWLHIYEDIDYPTYLNLRAVSHHFRNLIDEYIGLRVGFTKAVDENPDMFNFFCASALNDVQFEDARDPEKYSFEKILKYPSYLTDVSFTGQTNLKLVQDILQNCKSLQLVEMTMDCKLIKKEGKTTEESTEIDKLIILPGIDIKSTTPPNIAYLKHLECLKLVPGVHNDNNLRSHVALSIIRATKAPNALKKVIFQCELSEEITLTNVLTITAELIEEHPKLEALFMALLNDEYLLSSEEIRNYSHFMDLNEEQVNCFRKRIVDAGANLNIRKMGLAMLNPRMQLIWGDFLKTQHNLVHLSVTVTIEQGTFSQELFDTFCGTLEQLAIRGKFEVAFDFRHIKNCRNLKEICLHNLQENGGGGITPKCINLPQVADDLESLILFQVVARTQEIQETLRKLDKLNTLVVFKCGHAAGETGVGLECLQQILQKRTLQSVLVVQFICGSTTEAETLAGILYDMSQDAENQANSMRGRRRRTVVEEVVHEEVEVHDVLELPPVEGGRDVLIYPLGGDNPPQVPEAPDERPVSRGNHRIEGDLNGEANNVEPEPNNQAQNGALEEFPPLPLPEPPGNVYQRQPRNNNENNNNALNMIQNIFEQAFAGNPEPAERARPNLQNRMNLDQMEEEFMRDNVELILDMEPDDQDFGPVLDIFAAERLAREHNVQVGFILDGVIDIMNEEVVRSKWLCVEDNDGHITYTLKISVEL